MKKLMDCGELEIFAGLKFNLSRFSGRPVLCLLIAIICLIVPALHGWADTGDEKEYAFQRERMVAEQIEARGIHDPQVLKAMRNVKRHQFVPEGLRGGAYCRTQHRAEGC